jgi:hypothetical protein
MAVASETHGSSQFRWIGPKGDGQGYAPQAPGTARGPQKSPAPLTEMMSVLGSTVKMMVPIGVSLESVVFATTPVATSPDDEDRYPLAMSPAVMMLLDILSQGGGLVSHHV